MIRRLEKIEGLELRARDGKIGKVKDFYFDDRFWIVRYLVADTGGWLPGRKVLISPLAAERPDRESGVLPVSLTSEQIEDSPDIEREKPVSRQKEIELTGYYGWPTYWTAGPYPGSVAVRRPLQQTGGGKADTHLRSTNEVCGYRIHALDGDIGHVEDFLAEDDTWTIRYMIVDTRNWLPGKKVIISPDWIDRVSWADAGVHVDLTKDKIGNRPDFDPENPVGRDYEERLYDHYGKPAYWKE